MGSFLSYLIEAAYPDGNRDGTATPEQYRALHLLGLLRTVIDYGKQLIVAARQRAGTPDFLPFAAPFGTSSLKLLIARIGCAICRAVHLEQKLKHEAQLGGSSYRPEVARPAPDGRAPRATPRAGAAARSRTGRTGPARDPELAHLPTVAQIAAEIRRLPLQQVIAAICRDLCITPEHGLWHELNQALAAFGVSLPVPDTEHSPARPRAGATKQRADAPQPEASAAPVEPRPPIAVRQGQAPPRTGPPASAGRQTAA